MAGAQGTLDVSVAPSSSRVLMMLTGELDVETASQILPLLNGKLGSWPGDEVRLDLSDLSFLGVAGARALVLASDQVAHAGGHLTVQGLRRTACLVAEMTQLAQYVEIADPDVSGGSASNQPN
jgi:anti-anti-sigma factor